MSFFNTAIGRLILLGIGVMAISTAAPLIKLIPEVPSLVVAASRLSLATLILLPMGWRQKQTQPQETAAISRREIALVVGAGMCLALHFATWIASLRYTSVASSVALVTLNPLLLALAGYLIWSERLTRLLGIGIGLAITGSVCIAWNDFQSSTPHTDSALFGDMLAVCGAVMMSAYLVCGRLARPHMSLSLYTGLVYACAAGLLWGVCLITAVSIFSIFGYSGRTYIILLLVGLGPQLIGHTILNWALAYLSPTIVALAILAEPLGASLLAWLFLGESVSWLQAIGCILILAGIGLGNRQQFAREADSSTLK